MITSASTSTPKDPLKSEGKGKMLSFQSQAPSEVILSASECGHLARNEGSLKRWLEPSLWV